MTIYLHRATAGCVGADRATGTINCVGGCHADGSGADAAAAQDECGELCTCGQIHGQTVESNRDRAALGLRSQRNHFAQRRVDLDALDREPGWIDVEQQVKAAQCQESAAAALSEASETFTRTSSDTEITSVGGDAEID